MNAHRAPFRNGIRLLRLAVLAATVGACNQDPVATDVNSTSVDERPLLQVSVSPSSVSMHVGDSIVVRAEVRDRDGRLRSDLNPEWRTDAASLVIVSSDGMLARIIAFGAGEARVSAVAGDATGAISVRVVANDAPPHTGG